MSDTTQAPPHPATTQVQKKPPHPAVTMQRKDIEAPTGMGRLPPHPATLIGASSCTGKVKVLPHPATVAQRSASSRASGPQDEKPRADDNHLANAAQPMWAIPVAAAVIVGGYYAGKWMGWWGAPDWSRGVRAVATINAATPTVVALGTLIHGMDPGIDISSCSATATVLSGLVQGNRALTALPNVERMDGPRIARELTRLLVAPNLVYCAVKPDHHFFVIPISTDQLQMIQSYQGVFNYVDWRTNSPSNGRMRKSDFINDMSLYATQLLPSVRTASQRLFAYDARTRAEVTNYVNGAASRRIVMIAYFSL